MHHYIKLHRLDARLVNTIHDELQYEVHNRDVDKVVLGADKMMQERLEKAYWGILNLTQTQR